jgi:hypothetical protein
MSYEVVSSSRMTTLLFFNITAAKATSFLWLSDKCKFSAVEERSKDGRDRRLIIKSMDLVGNVLVGSSSVFSAALRQLRGDCVTVARL